MSPIKGKRNYEKKVNQAAELVQEASESIEAAKQAAIENFKKANNEKIVRLKQKNNDLLNELASSGFFMFIRKTEIRSQIEKIKFTLDEITSVSYQQSEINKIEEKAKHILQEYEEEMDKYINTLFPCHCFLTVKYGYEIVSWLYFFPLGLTISEIQRDIECLHSLDRVQIERIMGELVQKRVVGKDMVRGKAYFVVSRLAGSIRINIKGSFYETLEIMKDEYGTDWMDHIYDENLDLSKMGFPTIPNINF